MDYTQYIRAELFILIPVLMIIGKFIKASVIINDRHIPLVLGGISIVLSCAYLIIINRESVPYSFITGIVQGILISGAAVYGNQIFKQYTKKDE